MSIHWTAHPAKSRPDQLALVAAVVLLSAWTVLVTLESAFLALLAAVILTVAIAPFLLPTRYRVDDAGVEQRGLVSRRFRPWSELRRAQVGPGAALVSPFARPSWMDRHRGIVLYFHGLDADAKARLIAELRERLP